MTERISPRSGGLDLRVQLTSPGARPARETPFRILLVGDFSGRASRPDDAPASPLGQRKPLRVDRDNFEQVLERVQPRVQLAPEAPGGPQLTLTFREMDDFHPDSLFDRLELFQELRQLRRRLENPATFAAAAQELRSAEPPPPPAATAPEPPAPAPASGLSPDDFLSQVLSQTREGSAPPTSPALPGGGDWKSYLRALVAPHLAPNIDTSHQTQLLARVDETVGEQMRRLLHHPAFQQVEAAWRGVRLLVRRLETDEKLQVHLLDMTEDELRADLQAHASGGPSRLAKVLVEEAVQTPGGQPWSVIAALYTFGPTPGDVAALDHIATLAARAGAAFLGAAHEHWLGCPRLASSPDPRTWNLELSPETRTAWQRLRDRPESAFVGLALPRILLRAPYGRASDPTERFELEEMTTPPAHEAYLWGSPALACAYLLGRSFERQGWDFTRLENRIDQLPVHVYEDQGEEEVKPCAEVLLTDEAAEAILARGLIPLLSVRRQDAVLMLQLLSIASEPALVQGRWLARG